MTASARQHPHGAPLLPKPAIEACDLSITSLELGGRQQPLSPLPREQVGGGRNARAPVRARAHVRNIPRRIHPRESPVAAGPAAIIQQDSGTFTFSLPTLSARSAAPSNTKTFPPCEQPVDVATSLWNPEEILRRNCGRNEKIGSPHMPTLRACERLEQRGSLGMRSARSLSHP
jgi:hypothetical protein